MKALAPKPRPRAMDSKRGWAALAQDWAIDMADPDDMTGGGGSPVMSGGSSTSSQGGGFDSSGWDALCKGWGGGAAAMDEFEEGKHQRAENGQFGSGALGKGSPSSKDPSKKWGSYKEWNNEWTKILQKRNAAKSELEGSHKTGYVGNPKAQSKLDRWHEEESAHKEHPNAPRSGIAYVSTAVRKELTGS